MLLRPLVLASASPRRAALLQQIGLDVAIHPSEIDEPPPAPGEDVMAWARTAALAKARAVAARLPQTPCLVLGADTVVLLPHARQEDPRLHGQPVHVLGKPVDCEDARAMLRRLSGIEHSVVSAFALVTHPEGSWVADAVETRVRFRPLEEEEITAYLATGEPMDKAGAYGIQGRGAVLVEGITGDYNAVVGLPLAALWERLRPWRR